MQRQSILEASTNADLTEVLQLASSLPVTSFGAWGGKGGGGVAESN